MSASQWMTILCRIAPYASNMNSNFAAFLYYSGTPITDPPTSRQPLYNGLWLWHQLKLLQNLCLINLSQADAS